MERALFRDFHHTFRIFLISQMKVIVVAGARPNFMKIAPIVRALRMRQRTRPDLQTLLVHTGQHYDHRMSGSFFSELEIPEPDINLEVGSGSHAQQTARIMTGFEEICERERPDWVIVVGDVNSTMACAITAKKLGIAVGHVEAGLRSCDRSMPEEINRLCTDAISDLLFTTDRGASNNLRAEGVAPEKIHFVGNTMIDTLLQHVDSARAKPLPAGLAERQYAVLTLHRPSNVDSESNMRGIFAALEHIAACIPIVFPAHPRTAAKLSTVTLHPNIRVTEPMGYLSFLGLVSNARMVLTDSGGLQEETTVLGVPCITMRSNTERPITCEIGTNVLAGTDPEAIRRAALPVLHKPAGSFSIPEKWDGKAGSRIVEIVMKYTSAAEPERQPEFVNLAAAGS